VSRVLTAKTTVLVHFKPVRVVFLVLFGVVVALLTFLASECDFHSHLIGTSFISPDKTKKCLHFLCFF
jgi:hypothetical protein